MIAYLDGTITYKSPTHVHLDVNGVGYGLNVSIHTYSKIEDTDKVRLYTHIYIRDDTHTMVLYGFSTLEEKELFLMLTSVSGVGMNTARVILSSLQPMEVKSAISSGDSLTFKRIKGIGTKTAERVILDLRDKVSRLSISGELENINQILVKTDEAIAALQSLGFQKNQAEKAVMAVAGTEMSLEDILKAALKLLT